MISFIVTVACLAHIKVCPIPNGHTDTFKAPTREVCETTARKVIAGFGYPARDFKIECKEQ